MLKIFPILNKMLQSIRNLVAGKDLEELSRWRSNWEHYRRWLSEFPVIAMTLDNMKNEVSGTLSMDACHPPGKKGPWDIDGLRRHLRNIINGTAQAFKFGEVWHCTDDPKVDEIKRLQLRIMELETQYQTASELVLTKNREVNELRLVCGEAYQLAGSYERVNMKALENLYAAAKGTPLPHTSFMPSEM